CPNLLQVGARLPRRTAVPQHRRHQTRTLPTTTLFPGRYRKLSSARHVSLIGNSRGAITIRSQWTGALLRIPPGGLHFEWVCSCFFLPVFPVAPAFTDE